MDSYIFINNRLIREKSAAVPVNDAGFLYGDGIFETLRSYNGYVFMLEAHLQRMFHTLKILRYKFDFDKSYVKYSIDKAISGNNLKSREAYIKIIVTRGPYRERVNINSQFKPNLIIITRKLVSYPEKDYKNGVKIITSSLKRDALGNKLYVYKLINYFENIFAKNEALRNRAKEAIFLTKDHIILEGATSNIFFVKEGTVYTTPLTQNILPGITRAQVIELCKENKIKLRQRRIHYFDIKESDEIFLTNSIMEIMPVCQIDKYRVIDKVPGSITKKIMNLYKEKVNCLMEMEHKP